MSQTRSDSPRDPFLQFLAEHPAAGQRALQLIDEGRELLDAGKVQRAQRKFHQALGLCGVALPARTNLALTYLMQGQYDRAMRETEAALKHYPDNVFALCTLAECHVALGQREQAGELLDRAMRAMQRAVNRGHAELDDFAKLVEALAEVEDSRHIYHVYVRWVRGTPVTLDPLTWARLGIAAYNRGKFQAARWLWRAAGSDGYLGELLAVFQFAVDLIERDQLPHFTLDFSLGLHRLDPDVTDPPGFLKALALHTLWQDEDMGSREQALQLIAAAADPWASAVLFQLLRVVDLPDELKLKAGLGLIERGLIDPHEPVEMHIDGQLQPVLIREESAARRTSPPARAAKARQDSGRDRGAWAVVAAVQRAARRRERYQRVVVAPTMAWEDGLRNLTRIRLRGMAQALGMAGHGGLDKEQLVRALADQLRGGLGHVWTALSAQEKAAVRWIAERDGVARYQALLGRYGPDCADNIDWYPTPPASVAMRLQLFGLVFVGRLAQGDETVAVIPREVLRRLRAVWR